MLSELQQRKFRAYFNLLDNDGDGYLERSDFVAISDNFARHAGLSAGSDGYNAVHAAWLASWEHVKEVCEVDHDGRIRSDQWLATLERTISDEERYGRYVTPVAEGMFQLLDTDGDGAVGREEYRHFFASMRGEEKYADEAFDRLDADGDGHLSRQEVMTAVREFHTSSNPEARGNWLFGPF